MSENDVHPKMVSSQYRPALPEDNDLFMHVKSFYKNTSSHSR